MHFMTGKHMPRRTFLRGAMGATVALPFLDAMVAAKAVGARGAAAAERTRLICVEEVHGLAGCNKWGASKFLFAPEQTGSNFTILPDSALSSLEPYRQHMTIVSNTDVRMAEAFTAPEIGGDHFRSSAVFLTQSHPKQTQGSDIWAGTSFDQMYAQKYGQATPLPSMQFCIESLDQAGGCTYNYSCAYTDSISWGRAARPVSTNCGRKATKKSAVFGLSTFTIRPCRYVRQRPTSRRRPPIVPSGRRSSVRNPR